MSPLDKQPSRIVFDHSLGWVWWLALLPLLGAIAFFTEYHVLDDYFLEGSWVYAVYHLCQLVIALYLLWMVYFIGYVVKAWLEQRFGEWQFTPLEDFILAFFVGYGCFRFGFLLLGYLDLYRWWVAVALTLGLLILSLPRLKTIVQLCLKQVQGMFTWQHIPLWMLGGITLLSLLYMVTVRVFWGTLEWDSITHYNHYYQAVLRNHDVSPNFAWYHYYYLKGNGLHFLAGLLTDDMGYRIGTLVVVLMGMLTMFWFIRRLTSSAELGLLGINILAVACVLQYSYPFEKTHLLVGMLYLSILFGLVKYQDNPCLTGAYVLVILVCSTILTGTTTITIILPLLGIHFLLASVTRHWQAMRHFFIVELVAGLFILMIFCLNYFTSGLAEAMFFELFWKFADQKRFASWMSPYIVVYYIAGTPSPSDYLAMGKSYGYTAWFFHILHLSEINFLFLTFSPWRLIPLLVVWLGGGLAYNQKLLPLRQWYPVALLGGTVAFATALSLITGHPEESLYRHYTFNTPLLIILMLWLWGSLIYTFIKLEYQKIMSFMFIAFMLFQSFNYGRNNRLVPWQEVPKVLAGQRSYADMYTQADFLWEEAAEARLYVGLEERIYVVGQFHGLGTVPGRLLEAYSTMAYREWHVMQFGSAEEAKNAYQAEGINYFLVRLQEKVSVGIELENEFFQLETIQEQLEIIWHQNDTYLLTWKGASVNPLPWDDFVQGWNEVFFPTSFRYTDLYTSLKAYYDRNEGRAYPLDELQEDEKVRFQ